MGVKLRHMLRPSGFARSATVFIVLSILRIGLAQAEETRDLDSYYAYPLGISAEYRSLTALSSLPSAFVIFDASGILTVPLPKLPVLQPFASFGYAKFDSLDPTFPTKWDFYQVHASGGLAYSSRFLKNFEAGAEVSLGMAEAVFPNAVDSGTVGSPFFLLGLGGKVSLIPSYAISVDFRPSVRYQVALGPLRSFDGFSFCLGISFGFRFGEDPDAARPAYRSLRFDKLDLPDAFGALQSYYSKNALGSVTLANTEKVPLTEVEVSFMQSGFMDSPTPSASLPRLEPGEGVTVPLSAIFNSKVFETEGKTPLTGEIIATYRQSGRSAEQRRSVAYNLFDKTAIVWNDDRKEASFITPQDSALKNYTAFVSETIRGRGLDLPGYNEPLQIAMQVYGALRALGIFYQEDSSSPFTQVQGKVESVDSVTLPRLTLKRKFGDCDDLTALFCSLLETRNVETGFITVPGHIYAAFNTGEDSASFRDFSSDKGALLVVDDKVWIPVEVTMLDGTSGFIDAWAKGMELWNANEATRAFHNTRASQLLFGPVALKEIDLGLQYGNGDNVAAAFKQDRDRLIEGLIKPYALAADASRAKTDYNKLGLIQVRLGRVKEAEDSFARAIKLDPKFVSALVNLANVAYVKKDYASAIGHYKAAIQILASQGQKDSDASLAVLKNIARAYEALGKHDLAKPYLAQEQAIKDARAKAPAAAGSAGTKRNANEAAADNVDYLDEEPSI
jgi:hypothetical protein